MKRIVILIQFVVISSYTFATDSQQNRTDDLFFVGLASEKNIWASAYPINLGVYISDSIVIGIEYGVGVFKIANLFDRSEEQTGKYTSSNLYLRGFIGNSFNMIFGYHNRKWEGDFEFPICQTTIFDLFSCTNQVGEFNASLDVDASVLSAGIGNQWQFDSGITIGFDWIVLFSMLSEDKRTSVSEYSGSATLTSEQQSSFKRDVKTKIDDLADDAANYSRYPSFLSIMLGFSF